MHQQIKALQKKITPDIRNQPQMSSLSFTFPVFPTVSNLKSLKFFSVPKINNIYSKTVKQDPNTNYSIGQKLIYVLSILACCGPLNSSRLQWSSKLKYMFLKNFRCHSVNMLGLNYHGDCTLPPLWRWWVWVSSPLMCSDKYISQEPLGAFSCQKVFRCHIKTLHCQIVASSLSASAHMHPRDDFLLSS